MATQTKRVWQDYLFGHKCFFYCMAKEENDVQEKTAINTLELHYKPQEVQNGFIVRYEGTKEKTNEKINRFLLFDSHMDFLNYMQKPKVKHFFHEICLANKPRKPYFDIDIPKDKFMAQYPLKTNFLEAMREEFDLIIAHIVRGVKRVCESKNVAFVPQKQVVLCTSHGEEKMSGHITINHFFHYDYLEAEAFNVLVLQHVPAEFHPWIDRAVYNSFQNFRIVNNFKFESNREKKQVFEYKLFSDCVLGEYMRIENKEENKGESKEVNKEENKEVNKEETKEETKEKNKKENKEKNKGENKGESNREKLLLVKYEPDIMCHPTVYHFESCLIRPFTTNALPRLVTQASEFDYTLKRRAIAKEVGIWENEPADNELVNKVIDLMRIKFGLEENDKFPFRVNVAYATMISFFRVFPSYCQVCNKSHEKENPVVYIHKGNITFDCRRSKVHLGHYKTLWIGTIEYEEKNEAVSTAENDDLNDFEEDFYEVCQEEDEYKLTPRYNTPHKNVGVLGKEDIDAGDVGKEDIGKNKEATGEKDIGKNEVIGEKNIGKNNGTGEKKKRGRKPKGDTKLDVENDKGEVKQRKKVVKRKVVKKKDYQEAIEKNQSLVKTKYDEKGRVQHVGIEYKNLDDLSIDEEKKYYEKKKSEPKNIW